uniref:Uncharacterized protein n=1 Tax=Malurus cyaneus samueli TaxID=2593467 RepID=A0A8C5UB09_9PASS
MAPVEQDALAVREQIFHERVRECIICALLFASLYILCHFIITHFKKHTDFTAGKRAGAARARQLGLVPSPWLWRWAPSSSCFSIIAMRCCSIPQNYYIQWLNGSLIHGGCLGDLGRWVILAYGQGVETSVVLLLLSLLVLGMVWVASAIVGNDAASRQSLYDLWEYYLPYLYSCISLFGVLLLLLCTPFGLSIMFTVTGKLLVKPRLLEDLDEQLSCTRFEEAAVSHRIPSCWLNLDWSAAGAVLSAARASPWQRNLGYPLAMLGLLALTGISVLIVCFHVPGRGMGQHSHVPCALGPFLPTCSLLCLQERPWARFPSIFGSFGAALQVVLFCILQAGHCCPRDVPCVPHHFSTSLLVLLLTLFAAI